LNFSDKHRNERKLRDGVRDVRRMSVIGGGFNRKPDIFRIGGNVSKVPESDIDRR
jgi:hypothetical protein